MKRVPSFVLGAAVAASGLLAACGDSSSTPPAAPTAPGAPAAPAAPSSPAAPSAPASGGAAYDAAKATATIKVKATLKGEAPKMRPVKMDQDAECVKLHTTPVSEETVVCDGGKLANVIAYVSKGAEAWTYKTPTEAALMDQKGCVYIPHVFTVMVNQPITIKNSDPTMHNVHATQGANPDWNKAMLKGAKDLTHTFAKPELPAKFKCDVHGWMGARVGVFTHPFHGTTGADGTVSIKVPPGEYEISAWHEYDKFAAPAAQKVTVADGETKDVEFVYEAK
jgi:plastocyanin